MSIFKILKVKIHNHSEYSQPLMVLFGIFGLVNYPVFYIYWLYFSDTPYDDFWLRVGAVILCLVITVKDHWPSIFKPYLPLYWYVSVCYCLPFFVTYHFIQNPSSMSFSLNFILALFWLIAVLDWASFAIILPVGVLTAYTVHLIQGGTLHAAGVDILGILINVAWVIITSLLFIRKKDGSYQEKINTMKMLAGSIAHELRTPLSAIMVNSDALSRYLPYYQEAYFKANEANVLVKKLHPNEHANFNKIPSSLQKLSCNAQTMINMLLTNLSEGNDNHKEELCSMNQCIKEALTEYPFAAHEKTMIHWNNTDDFLFLGQKQMMKHVIFNLLKNALYAIAAVGKGEISIHLESSNVHGTNNRLVFKDTGSGIDARSLPHIFDRFYTKTRHGTGIGLAFCQSVIRGFGGEISCSSQVGEHTIFTITLPILKDEKLREVVA